jgi:hypothetical protein
MCCHPYDNCGPVVNGDACQSCDTRARVGSVFAGTATDETTVSESNQTPTPAKPPKANDTPTPAKPPKATNSPTPAKVPGKTAAVRSKKSTHSQSASFTQKNGRIRGQVQGQARPGLVPGSEKIVSVTDRVVEPSGNPTAAQEVAQETVEKPIAEPAKLQPSQGWVARQASW